MAERGAGRELISRRLRHEVREELSASSTLGAIADLFQVEGFTETQEPAAEVRGERRGLVESYYAATDWTSEDVRQRFLVLVERVLDGAPPQGSLADAIRRDGYRYEDGRLLSTGPVELRSVIVGAIETPDALLQELARLEGTVDVDASAAIGHAKDLVEATLKHVILATGGTVGGHEKFGALVKRAQVALGLDAAAVPAERKHAEALRRILGGLSQLAIGLNDLRNASGTGHGRSELPAGVSARHARLAAGAAALYCRLLIETLTDPRAPWRREAEPGPGGG